MNLPIFYQEVMYRTKIITKYLDKLTLWISSLFAIKAALHLNLVQNIYRIKSTFRTIKF